MFNTLKSELLCCIQNTSINALCTYGCTYASKLVNEYKKKTYSDAESFQPASFVINRSTYPYRHSTQDDSSLPNSHACMGGCEKSQTEKLTSTTKPQYLTFERTETTRLRSNLQQRT